MRTVLAILIVSLVSPSLAQENPIRGRMICEVAASKFAPVSEENDISIDVQGGVYSPGATLNFDYAHDLEGGVEIFFG